MNDSKTLKIAILGKANSGKNTTAELIAEGLECPFGSTYAFTPRSQLLAFADPIKAMVMQMFPWAQSECLYGPSALRSLIIPNAFNRDGQPLTYRQVLIDLGKQGRAYDPDHWVKVFHHRISGLLERKGWSPTPELIVCPDLRFPNELTYLKDNGFYIVKLARNSQDKIDDVSETSQDAISDEDIHCLIDNNGTLEELQSKVLDTITQIRKLKI